MGLQRFIDFLNEQETIPTDTNQMAPGGQTPIAGQALGTMSQSSQQKQDTEDQETIQLSGQILQALNRLLPKIEKLRNRDMAVEIVAQIINAIHQALPQVTQTALTKVIKKAFQPPQIISQQPPQQQQNSM